MTARPTDADQVRAAAELRARLYGPGYPHGRRHRTLDDRLADQGVHPLDEDLGWCPVCPDVVFRASWPAGPQTATFVVWEGERVPVHAGCEADAKHALDRQAREHTASAVPTLADLLDADDDVDWLGTASRADRDRDDRTVAGGPATDDLTPTTLTPGADDV